MAKRPARTRSARGTLNRERVLREALALADAGGLEALSMRSLGHALGVGAMALYNHVDGKEDLLEGIVELVLADVAWSAERVGWREAMRQRARSTRRVLLRHFWAAALIESASGKSEVRYRYADSVLGCLRGAGFSAQLAYNAMILLDSYVYGFALQEVSWSAAPAEASAKVSRLEPRTLADRFPHLVEVMEHFAKAKAGVASGGPGGPTGYEPEFDFGLDVLLEGLERLKDGARRRRHRAVPGRR